MSKPTKRLSAQSAAPSPRPSPPKRRSDARERAAEQLLSKAIAETGQSRAQLRQVMASVTEQVNRTYKRGRLEDEANASLLFRTFFGHAPSLAFETDRRKPSLFLAFRMRAGRTLDFGEDEVDQLVQVGAVNVVRAQDDRWINLDWNKRLALLELIDSLHDLKAFDAGLAYAARPNTGLKPVQDWVATRRGGRNPRGRGRPGGPTLRGAEKFTEAIVPLESPQKLERLVTLLQDAPDDTREKLVEQLRRARAVLTSVLARFDGALDE